MKLYSCKVRLGGSLYNEVPKADVTAAEIALMRVIHGNDAIVEIVETGKNKTTQTEERERLQDLYGQGLMAQQLGKTPDSALSAVFGIAGRLPEEIPGAPKAKPAEKPPVVEEPDPPEDDPEK